MCVLGQGRTGRKWGVNDWRVRLRPPEDFYRRTLGSDPDRLGPELPVSFSFPFLVQSWVTPVLKDIPLFFDLRHPNLQTRSQLVILTHAWLPFGSHLWNSIPALQLLCHYLHSPFFSLTIFSTWFLRLASHCLIYQLFLRCLSASNKIPPPPYCSSISAGTHTHCGIPNSIEGTL